jgi:NAD-dependent DNA ligase
MTELTEIKGVGPATAKVFAKVGFSNVKDVASARPVDLAAVPGVGEIRATRLIAAARSLLAEPMLPSSGNGLDQSAAQAEEKREKTSKDKKKGKKAKNKKDKSEKSKNKKKKAKNVNKTKREGKKKKGKGK